MDTNDQLMKARELFFMQRPKRFLLNEIDDAAIADEDIRLTFSVFKATLLEIVRVVQAFYNMTMAATIDAEFNRFFTRNLLLTRADFLEAKKELNEEEIRTEAKRRTTDELNVDGHDDELLRQVAERLLTLSSSAPELVSDTNCAILRQSSVMLWSATESLLREVFRLLVNRQPSLASRLFSGNETKRFWNTRDLSLDLIEGAGYDLKHCMGDVLLELNSMISLKAIRAGYEAIAVDSDDLLKLLKSEGTYKLFTLRNLVAHRNGVVDQKFLAESSFSGSLGNKVTVGPIEFEEMYMAAKGISTALYRWYVSEGDMASHLDIASSL